MGVTNQGSAAASLQQVRTNFFSIYDTYYATTPSQVAPFVRTQPLSNKAYVHSFITSHPVMREWSGARVSKSVRIESVAGEVRSFEQTGDIPMIDIESDTLAPYMTMVQNFGGNAATHTDQLFADRLNNGTSIVTLKGATTTAGYDGAALFGNHTRDDGSNQSNNFTSKALTKANLHDQIEAMMGLTYPNGEPVNLNPTHLVVPTALHMTGRELLFANLLGITGEGSTSNVVPGMGIQLVTLPRLTSATTWFLIDASRGPIADRYVLKETTPTGLLDPTDPNVFFEDKAVFGTTTRDELLLNCWEFIQRNIA